MLCGAHPHLADNLCEPCLIDIPWSKNTCHQCAEHMELTGIHLDQTCINCLTEPPPYSRTLCAFDYLVPINGLMNQFKHQHNLAAGRLLTACLSQTILQTIEQGKTTVPQLLIPVPLHERRLRQRGFNQAQFIAAGLSKSLQVKVNSGLCQRSSYQTPQQGQSRQQRIKQMEGSFALVRKGMDQGITRVAIVDDVMTTGATTQALSRCLINAWDGPLDIQVWCVARAQPPNIRLEW